MKCALKKYTLSVLPPCANTMGQRAFSLQRVRGFVQSSGAAVSPFSLPLFVDRVLSTQNGLSTKVQDKQLQIECGSDSGVFGKQLPLGLKIKDQPFSILSRESRNLIFFLWVSRNGSLIRRHNRWTWELLNFVFFSGGKNLSLYQNYSWRWEQGLVIVRHATVLSLAASASEQAQ